MKKIFESKSLYPKDGVIKAHYSDFESVFIGLLPFIKLDSVLTTNSYKHSVVASKEEGNIILDSLGLKDGKDKISYITNVAYPTAKQISASGKPITWSSIIRNASFKDYSDLCLALGTSIGAYKQIYSSPILAKKLNEYTTNKKIWHPQEGQFGYFTAVSIYQAFKEVNKFEICLTDEFYERTETFNLRELNAQEFYFKIYWASYIYSEDKKILFAIDWDSFYFLIATDNVEMNKITSANIFEGFLCNNETPLNWELPQS